MIVSINEQMLFNGGGVAEKLLIHTFFFEFLPAVNVN